MKIKTWFTGAVLMAFTVGSGMADDAMRVKVPLKAPQVSQGALDREFEIRVGPRVVQTAGAFRAGATQLLSASPSGMAKNNVDIRRDLGHDGVTVGVQFDADWQFSKNWHLNFGYKFDQSNATKTLDSSISFANQYFAAGSSLKTDVDLHQFDYTVGYDIYKDETFRVQPFFGGKTVYTDVSVSGTRTTAPTASTFATSPFNSRVEDYLSTYLCGFDVRINLSRDWYLGVTPSASGMDNWYLIQGQFYTGYDLNKNWGVRVGFDCEYADNNVTSANQQQLGIGAAYIQMVWGY